MQTIALDEQKKLQFDILCDVHDFCVKHGIIYFLSSGTLIGAIRHQGFIPWDDDIDIAMPRKDYDLFFQLYTSKYYQAMNLEIDSEWPYIMGKVYDTRTMLQERYKKCKGLGVFIDIFPLDGLPGKKLIRYMHLRVIFALRYLSEAKTFPASESANLLKYVYHKLFQLIMLPISNARLLHWLNGLIRKYNWDEASYVASLASLTERKPCKKSCFEYVELKKFELGMFYVPCGYDEWLRLVFGDYMQLPPVEQRVPKHACAVVWRDSVPGRNV